jgi:colicin import membrane protein
MADQAPAAPDGTATATPAPGGTPGASPASTPTGQGAADAAGKGTDTVEHWKAQAEAAKAEAEKAAAERVKWEREAKQAFEARDKAKARFLDSEEGKAYAEAKAKLDKLDEEAALKRGEHEKLLTARTAELEAERKARAEERRTLLDGFARKELARTFLAVGGKDADWFAVKLDKAISEGSVRIADDGTVTGAPELMKKLAEAHPALIPNGAAAAVEKLIAGEPAAIAAQAGALAERDKRKQPTPTSLASFSVPFGSGFVPPGAK